MVTHAQTRFSRFASARRLPGSARQQGVALFISLVLLLVLTIAGVSAVQTTSLEERMARNTHDSLLAFQAAESALREAENFLATAVNTTANFTDGGAGGLWTVADYGQTDRWEVAAQWADGAGNVEVATAVGYVNDQPKYMIEHVADVISPENPNELGTSYGGGGAAPIISIFRITARGVGGSANAQVLLQSTYGIIF